MSDRSWADFRLELFGEPYMVWHDGPDFSRIVAEWSRDPELVERMLLRGLGEGDSLAAQAVRELPLDEAATARLAEALQRAPGSNSMAVQAGQSLARLTGDEAHARSVIRVLTGTAHWGEKIDAAMALARFTPTEALIQALEQGLLDEEYLVRYHSANSLLRYTGVEAPDISSMPEEFAVVCRGRRKARAALRDRLGAAARARLA